MPQQVAFFFEDENDTDEQDIADINAKFSSIMDKLDAIDAALNDKVSGWNTERMAKVDLTILRLAVYEIQFDENILQV